MFNNKIITKIIIALPSYYNNSFTITINEKDTIMMEQTAVINHYHIFEKSVNIYLNHYWIEVQNDINAFSDLKVNWTMNTDDIDYDEVKIICQESVCLPEEHESRYGLRMFTEHGVAAISVFVANMGG
jgi:hypothetical protein